MFDEKKDNVKYYRVEKNGILRLVNGVDVDSLDINGNWIPNQYFYSMFVDGMVDYVEITEDEVKQEIEERKNGKRGFHRG